MKRIEWMSAYASCKTEKTRVKLRLTIGTVSYGLKENHTTNTCAGLKTGKKHKKCQLRSAPHKEGDSTARDTIIHCIQRNGFIGTGRLSAPKQLLEYLA